MELEVTEFTRQINCYQLVAEKNWFGLGRSETMLDFFQDNWSEIFQT